MTFTGTIVSHDPSLHSGLVLPDGHAQAVGFTEGDVMNWRGATALFGERVTFHVVQTPTGYAAIQLVLLEPPRQKKLRIRPGNLMAAVVGPILVGAMSYSLWRYAHILYPFAYVVSISVMSLAMFIPLSNSPSSHRRNPAEVTLLLFAFCGGAPSLFLANLLIPTRFRSEATLALLFALSIIQFIVAKAYFPILFEWRLWQLYLTFADLNFR